MEETVRAKIRDLTWRANATWHLEIVFLCLTIGLFHAAWFGRTSWWLPVLTLLPVPGMHVLSSVFRARARRLKRALDKFGQK